MSMTTRQATHCVATCTACGKDGGRAHRASEAPAGGGASGRLKARAPCRPLAVSPVTETQLRAATQKRRRRTNQDDRLPTRHDDAPGGDGVGQRPSGRDDGEPPYDAESEFLAIGGDDVERSSGTPGTDSPSCPVEIVSTAVPVGKRHASAPGSLASSAPARHRERARTPQRRCRLLGPRSAGTGRPAPTRRPSERRESRGRALQVAPRARA